MIKCAFSHGQHNYERKVKPMTKEEIDYAVDLLYVIDAKKKVLNYSDKLTVKLYLTEADLITLESIMRKVLENGVHGNN